jgi:hypothetical protein
MIPVKNTFCSENIKDIPYAITIEIVRPTYNLLNNLYVKNPAKKEIRIGVPYSVNSNIYKNSLF